MGPRAGLRRGRRAAQRAKHGRVATRVFMLFATRHSLPEIVIATKLPPQSVRELYDEWRTSLEDGARRG